MDKDIKNHIHNTLGITKKDIVQMVEKSVEATVTRHIDKFISERKLLLAMEQGIERVINGKVNTRNMWSESETFEKWVMKFVESEVKRKVASRIKFNIRVE